MAEIKPPAPVKLFVGILTARRELLDAAREKLVTRYGAVDCETESMPFAFTDYYEREMGAPLVKKFWSFEKLIQPEFLAKIKYETNVIESGFVVPGAARPVNLDPGYLTLAKVVLATAKDFPHRIYIGDGIYAEVTLFYEKEKWRANAWTYPDYRQEKYHDFFNRMRGALLSQLRSIQ